MKPPALANWLLTRLVPAPHLETIAGDLDEQFAKGRSGFWYWRQALNTILVHGVQDLRSSKVMANLAVVVGWLSLFALQVIVNSTMLLEWSRQSAFVGLALTALGGMNSGFVIVRLWRRFSMVLPFLFSMWLLSLVWSGFVIVGAVGVRIQRPTDLAIGIAVMFVLVPIGIVLGGVTAAPGRHDMQTRESR